MSFELSTEFRNNVTTKIRDTIMGLIPDEKLQELVDKEINEFFFTEQVLALKETKIETKNLNYEPSNYYNRDRTHSIDALVFKSKMTPFRQLVWTEIHQFMLPKVKAILNNEQNELTKALLESITESKEVTTSTYREVVQKLMTQQSTALLSQMTVTTLNTAHYNMIHSLGAAGFNTTCIPTNPLNVA